MVSKNSTGKQLRFLVQLKFHYRKADRQVQ